MRTHVIFVCVCVFNSKCLKLRRRNLPDKKSPNTGSAGNYTDGSLNVFGLVVVVCTGGGIFVQRGIHQGCN